MSAGAGAEAEIVRLVPTAEGLVPRDTAIRNLAICLRYLEIQARNADLPETAELIAIATLSVQEDS